MSCNRCRQSSCCCGTPVSYLNADVCAEDHTQKIYVNQFSFSVCPSSSWNVPICGSTALLEVQGLVGATVGAFLWHPDYGYFEISSVNANTGMLGITNTCVSGNASPGTQIPACTCFVVTAPPADTNPSSQVCLAVSFTAPAEGDSIDITLTSTTGLSVGDTIEFGSGFYYLAEIKPDNVVTITNIGEGIVPGTPVIAQDANGNYLNCIGVIQTSPCSRPEVDEGSIVACDDEGIVGPLNPDTFNGFNSDAVSLTKTFVAPATSGTTVPAVLTLINPSPTRPMTIMVQYIFAATYVFVVDPAGPTVTFEIEVGVNGGPPASILPLTFAEDYPPPVVGLQTFFKQVVATTTHQIAAGATLTLSGTATLDGTAPVFTTASIQLQMKAINISI